MHGSLGVKKNCHMGSHKMKGTDSGKYHVARQLSDMANITYVILAISLL